MREERGAWGRNLGLDVGLLRIAIGLIFDGPLYLAGNVHYPQMNILPICCPWVRVATCIRARE
jgi:hypothetical protein